MRGFATTGQLEERIRGEATRCRSAIGFLSAVAFSSLPLESIPTPGWPFRKPDDTRYFYELALNFPPHNHHSGGPAPTPLPERRKEIQLSRSGITRPGSTDIAGNITTAGISISLATCRGRAHSDKEKSPLFT